MKRLGRCSGKIYDEDQVDLIEECCYIISDRQAENDKFIREQYVRSLAICHNCYGCPVAKATILKEG